MLELLCKDFIINTLDAHNARTFNTEAAAYCLSEKLLTSHSYIAPIAASVRREAEPFIADQNAVIPQASKKENVAAKEACVDFIKAPPSRLDLGMKEPHHSSSSRR